MCRWKSPRSIRRCELNSSAQIRTISRAVFQTRNERRRLELLTHLRGVGISTAAAILTLVDPKQYGALDTRVWQVLFRLKSVSVNPRGVGFTPKHWLAYLGLLRYHAKRLGVSARRVEYSLFLYHQRMQVGTLYRRLQEDARPVSSASLGRSRLARK
jgi:thermostable 8-oxoguanine DNA glycosylase